MTVAAVAPRLSARQQQVLDSLEETFLAEGLELTVGELAMRARCSRRTLYEIAPSKEQLFLLTFDRMMNRVGKDAREAAAAQPTAAAAVQAYMLAALPPFRQLGFRFNAALDAYRPAARIYARHVAIAQGRLTEILAAGVAAGEFSEVDVDLVSETLTGAARHVIAPTVLSAGTRTPQEALAEVVGLLLNGLLVR